jgi:hypothetical protein
VARNAKGFVPVLKSVSMACAVSLCLVAGLSQEALAQDSTGICTIANTCSEAFFQCVATRCPVYFDAACNAACKSQFNTCMTTGTFASRDCRGKSLIRK